MNAVVIPRLNVCMGGVDTSTRIAPAEAIDDDWLVVHTKVRQEEVAARNLERQGYMVYLPQIKLLKRIRGRQRFRLEPLFPRYLFVRPLVADQSISSIRSTVGVSSLVRFGHRLAVIRDEIVERIRAVEIHRNSAPESEITPFQPGEVVRVADGPLAGMEGLVSEVKQERVTVLLRLLGDENRVSLSYHQLVVGL